MIRTILIALLLIMLIATPAAAAGYYHSLTIEVSGEYEMSTTFAAPDVFWGFEIEGIGSLKLNSIIAATDYNANWFNLF